jgi:hypothetical protein
MWSIKIAFSHKGVEFTLLHSECISRRFSPKIRVNSFFAGSKRLPYKPFALKRVLQGISWQTSLLVQWSGGLSTIYRASLRGEKEKQETAEF